MLFERRRMVASSLKHSLVRFECSLLKGCVTSATPCRSTVQYQCLDGFYELLSPVYTKPWCRQASLMFEAM